jgi:type I restriction enzyme S subunit
MSEMVSFVRMGELVRISKGKKPKSISDNALDDTYLPYLLIDSFGGEYNQFTNDITCRLVNGVDIEIVWDGERAGLVSKGNAGYLGSTLAAVSLTNEVFDSNFIFYNLQEKQKHLRQGAEGTGVPHLSRWVVNNIPICALPLPEQKKIASILSSVDDVIETTQKQIDKLQNLKKATMNELLTKGIGHTEFKDSELGRIPKSWEVKEIGKLGDIVTGSTPSTTNRDLYDGNYMFVSPADISDGMFISKTGKKLSLAGLNKTRKIPEKSVMVVCIGSTIGKVAISTQECASNQQINSIIPQENDAYFVYFAMKWMAHLIKKEAGTQAVPLINKTEFSNLFVPVPPRDEQMKIGIALHSINVGIDKLNAKLSQTQSLKKSLMQDLLTGKVRVQVN